MTKPVGYFSPEAEMANQSSSGVITQDMLDELEQLATNAAMSGQSLGFDYDDISDMKAGDPLMPLVQKLVWSEGRDAADLGMRLASQGGISPDQVKAETSRINQAGINQRGTPGGLIGSALTNVVTPIAETARDNPALLFGAPLALAAAGGYFGAAGAGGVTGTKAGSTATQVASTTAEKAALGAKASATGATGGTGALAPAAGGSTSLTGVRSLGTGQAANFNPAASGSSAASTAQRVVPDYLAAAGPNQGASTAAGGFLDRTVAGLQGNDRLNLGLSLLGGASQSRAAGRAADASIAANREALDYQRETRDMLFEQSLPQRESANRAIASLQDLSGMERTPALAGEPKYNWQKDPGYQFRMDEGMRAVNSAAAMRGGGQKSGAWIKSALRFGQGYASNEYEKIVNRVSSLAGLTMPGFASNQGAAINFANNAGNIKMDEGITRGSGYIAQGNAWANSANQISEWLGSRNKPQSPVKYY